MTNIEALKSVEEKGVPEFNHYMEWALRTKGLIKWTYDGPNTMPRLILTPLGKSFLDRNR